MSRKWTLWITVLLLGTLVVVGCAKKKPAAPVQDIVVEQPPPPPTQVVAPPPPPPIRDVEERDPLASADLREVNEEAIRRGFQPNIYFDFDKSDLKPEALDALAKNAQFLRQHPQFIVTVEGHCDERGTNEYNIALGDRRSSAARSYLTSSGVDAARLRTISYGEERPVCTESDESCWWRNRRAHFAITGRTS